MTYAQEHYKKHKEVYIERAKKRYQENKEAKHLYDKERRFAIGDAIREQDRDRYYAYRKTSKTNMLRSAKQRAKKKNLSCTISIDDFDIPETCPILGITLDFNFGSGGKDNSPTLDRINNDLGYIEGNVQVISAKANRMKSNGTPEDIKKLYLWTINKFPHFEIDK